MAKKMKIAFLDYGTFLSVAERFARDEHEVYYYCPRSGPFPTNDRDMIGTGIPGIIKILEDEFWQRIPEVDFIVFPFINDGGKQLDILRQGKPVFGTRLGDRLERDRKLLKQTLLGVGLPIVPFDGKQQVMEVRGFDAIRNMLQRTKDKWIKISDYRGLGETRKHVDYKNSEAWLFDIAHQLGTDRHDFPVLFEDSVAGTEIGDDQYFTAGRYFPLGLFGIEDKGNSYTCRVTAPDKMPRLVRQVRERMTPVFTEYGVQSIISTELRVPDKDTAYLIDLTMRHPGLPTEIACELWQNLPEIYQAVAMGEIIVPDPGKMIWGASVQLYSNRVQKEVTPVIFPEKYADRVKLQNYCIDRDGQYNCIPQDEDNTLGAVVGLGRTMEDAQLEAIEIAESVKAEGMHFDSATFDKIDEDIEKARRLGCWI